MSTCTYTHTHIHEHTHIMWTCTYTHRRINTYTHVQIHILYVYTRIHVHTQKPPRTHTHTYIHVYTHTEPPTLTYTHRNRHNLTFSQGIEAGSSLNPGWNPPHKESIRAAGWSDGLGGGVRVLWWAGRWSGTTQIDSGIDRVKGRESHIKGPHLLGHPGVRRISRYPSRLREKGYLWNRKRRDDNRRKIKDLFSRGRNSTGPHTVRKHQAPTWDIAPPIRRRLSGPEGHEDMEQAVKGTENLHKFLNEMRET